MKKSIMKIVAYWFSVDFDCFGTEFELYQILNPKLSEAPSTLLRFSLETEK